MSDFATESAVNKPEQLMEKPAGARRAPDLVPPALLYGGGGHPHIPTGEGILCRQRSSTCSVAALWAGRCHLYADRSRVELLLACALVNQACRQGLSACCLRMPKFSEEMAIAHGSGGYAKLLAQRAKTESF